MKRHVGRVASALAWAAGCCLGLTMTGGAFGQQVVQGAVQGIDARIIADAATMNLNGVTAGDIVSLDIPQHLPDAFTVSIPGTSFKEMSVTMQRGSIRSEAFALAMTMPDGTQVQLPMPAVRTYQGSITGTELGARGSLMQSAGGQSLLASVWLEDGSRILIQPLSDFQPGAPANLHVVYRGEDTACVGMCGNGPAQGESIPAGGFGERGSCGGNICVADIALDLDTTFVANQGGTNQALDRAEAVINVMNFQYSTQVNITHRISFALTRGAEPYNTNDINTLLVQLRDDWNTNRSGTTRDMTHLFTSRNTGGTIGLAYIGQVCNSNTFAYGVSQVTFSSAFGCQTDLVAHELGHNWNANHCTCPGSTMNPFITCTNTFLGDSSAPGDVGTIDAFRDSRGCLAPGAARPVNDSCTGALTVRTLTVTGDSTGATSDGGVVGCGVPSGGNGGGENDVWYAFTAPSGGNVTIDTCGSAIDTVLSVHTGCPGSPVNLVVCDDDGGGCTGQSFRSRVTFAAAQGQRYLVRVAGWNGQTGAFTLNFSGPGTGVFGGDTCSFAQSVTNGSYIGSIFGATNDAAGTCGLTSTATDVWYRFVAECDTTLTVNTCGSHDWNGVTDSGMDTVVSLYSACGGVVLACDDDEAIAGCTQNGSIRDSLVSAAVTAGSTTLIRVASFNNGFGNGMFVLNVNASCPVPPNDTCANATRIYQDGTYTGNNAGAATDGSSCGFNVQRDVYWVFTSPTTGTATISTCGSTFDTVLSVHAGCPASTDNQIACNDDNFCASTFTLQSAVSFPAIQGDTYIIKVAGYNNQAGNITLNVDAPTRATSDDCSAPTPLAPGFSTIGSLYDNTASGINGSCGSGTANRDAYYSFISGDSGTLTVSTCGTRDWNGLPNSGTDTVVSLFSSCGAPIITCSDGGVCGGFGTVFDSTVTAPYVAGTPLIIRVSHFGSEATWYGNGMFQIVASVGSSCDSIDFNNDSSFFDPQDIDAFLSVYSEGPCIPGTATCNDIDFNNDGSVFDPCDFSSFLTVYGEGPCTPCGG